MSAAEINRALAAYIAKESMNSENFKNFKMTFGFQVLGAASEPFKAFDCKKDFASDDTNA